MSRQSVNAAKNYRLLITTRVMLASFGAFILISVSGATLAQILYKLTDIPLAQAVHIFTLLSFIAWVGIAMWIFHCGSLKKVTWQMAITIVLGLIIYFILTKLET